MRSALSAKLATPPEAASAMLPSTVPVPIPPTSETSSVAEAQAPVVTRLPAASATFTTGCWGKISSGATAAVGDVVNTVRVGVPPITVKAEESLDVSPEAENRSE